MADRDGGGGVNDPEVSPKGLGDAVTVPKTRETDKIFNNANFQTKSTIPILLSIYTTN